MTLGLVLTTEEWVDGKKVRHSHLFRERYEQPPRGFMGFHAQSLIHEHSGRKMVKHLHPLIDKWDEEDGPSSTDAHTFYLYGPAMDLPEPIDSWDD